MNPAAIAALDRLESESDVRITAYRNAGREDLAQAESDRLDIILSTAWGVSATPPTDGPAAEQSAGSPTAMLSPREVAEHCGLDYRTILRAIERGTLPATRFGRSALRVKRSDMLAWIDAHAARVQDRSVPPRTPRLSRRKAPTGQGSWRAKLEQSA